MKRSTKYKAINVCLLERKVLRNILRIFRKIYERVTKKLIDKAMDKYLSPFISAYQQNYSTQNVLIRLLDGSREGLHNNFVVGGVFTYLKPSVAFLMIY